MKRSLVEIQSLTRTVLGILPLHQHHQLLLLGSELVRRFSSHPRRGHQEQHNHSRRSSQRNQAIGQPRLHVRLADECKKTDNQQRPDHRAAHLRGDQPRKQKWEAEQKQDPHQAAFKVRSEVQQQHDRHSDALADTDMDNLFVSFESAARGLRNPRPSRDQRNAHQGDQEMTKVLFFSEKNKGREETQRPDGQEPQELVPPVVGSARVRVADRDDSRKQKVSQDSALLDPEEVPWRPRPARGKERQTEKNCCAQQYNRDPKNRQAALKLFLQQRIMAHSRSRDQKSRQAALKPWPEEGQRLKLGHEQHRHDESGRKLPQGDQNTRHGESCQENRDRPDPQIENPVKSQQRNQDR